METPLKSVIWDHLTISKYEAVNYFGRRTGRGGGGWNGREGGRGGNNERCGRFPQLNHGVGDWTL